MRRGFAALGGGPPAAPGLAVHPPRRGAEQEPGDSGGRQRAAERGQYFFEPDVAAVVAVVLLSECDNWSRLRVGGRVRRCRVRIAAQARLGRSDLRLGVEDAGEDRRIARGPYTWRRRVDGGLRRPCRWLDCQRLFGWCRRFDDGGGV